MDMWVSDERRFVFIHIQKTGGTSLETLLRKQVPDLRLVGGRHEHLRRIPTETRGPWADYFKFAFVRNPWDRLVSYHAMIEARYRKLSWLRRRFLRNPMKLPIWNLAVPYLGDFPAFVRECTDEVFDGDCWKSFAYNQCDYVEDEKGALGVDFVGRFESLSSDVAKVLEHIGLDPAALPHRNSSAHRHYGSYYDAALRDVVAERFRRDIERFGYGFEAAP